MNKFVIITLSVLMISLSGCVTSRGFVHLAEKQDLNQSETLNQIAVIKIVEDNRVFENRPKTPNIPSLKGGIDKATDQDKAKAIARKRNGYGKALGDIMLEDETVSSVVKSRLIRALNQTGYRVVASSSENDKNADLIVSVEINKFWSWVEIGAWSGKLNTEIETTILNDKDPSKNMVVGTKLTRSVQVVTGAKWIDNTNIALDEYEEKLTQKLKSK